VTHLQFVLQPFDQIVPCTKEQETSLVLSMELVVVDLLSFVFVMTTMETATAILPRFASATETMVPAREATQPNKCSAR